MEEAHFLDPSRISPRLTWFARGALAALLLLTLLFGLHDSSHAEQLRPERGEEVLARVPARNTAEGRELVALESRAAQAPADVDAAVELARVYIERARSEGDPRFLSYAEATIAPFTRTASPPAQVLLLRAILRQSRHDFSAALDDLERVLAADAADAQALLTQASVLLVTGQHAKARESCARLSQVAALAGLACTAQVDGVSGHAAAARATLEQLLPQASRAADRAWLLSLLGELAYWSGDTDEAAARLSAALALTPDDRYTRGVYADVLLEQGKHDEVRALLSGIALDHALALRDALAEQGAASGATAGLLSVEQRLAEARLRGDLGHQREEARLALAQGRPAIALARALENFGKQQELWDVRLVLEAALAAADRQAAAPALRWLEQTGCEAKALRALARRVKEQS